MIPTPHRLRPTSWSLLAGAVVLGTLLGCKIPLENKADEKTEKAGKSGGSQKEKKKTDGESDKGDGPIWTDTVLGETKPMSRIELTEADVKGLSILAPVGSKIDKPLGGTGVEISLTELGFLVWVHEDRTATFDLMKKATLAWSKDAKFVDEGKSSFIVSMKSFDDTPAYFYKGLYSFGSKIIVCETPTSIMPGEKSHAEQIKKVCDSLQGPGGVALAGGGGTTQGTASAAPAKEKAPSPSALAAQKKAKADAQNAKMSEMLGGKPAKK